MLVRISQPTRSTPDDTLVNVSYSASIYKNWVETGIAEVDSFLSALGFSNQQQIAGFCLTRNVFDLFSTKSFIGNFIINQDNSALSKNQSVNRTFLPKSFPMFGISSISSTAIKPSYETFYQFLFSWITHGHDPYSRKKYIEYCESKGLDPKSLAAAPTENFSAPVLKSFKDAVSSYLQNQKKLQESVQCHINIGSIQNKPVSKMSREEKVSLAIWRCLPLLPAEVANELKQLLTPAAITIMVVVLAVWAASHFFGVGEIIDVILIIVGAITLGPIAVKAAEHLYYFASKSLYAKNETDINQAAKHLADAISLIGVQVVMALLLKKAPKVLNQPRNRMGTKLATPYNKKTIGTPPKTEGSIFYKPKTTILPNSNRLGKSGGITNQWGDVYLVLSKVASEAKAAKIHELVHRFLTPKLQVFPRLRQNMTILKSNSYMKSYILRYLEEALAETVAQMATRGVNWRSLLVGLKFPFGTNGGTMYVTKAAMKTEAMGVLLGPINVGGMVFNVYYAYKSK